MIRLWNGGHSALLPAFKSARWQWLQSRVWLDGLFVTRCPLHTEANDSAMWLGRFGCLIAESRGQQADAESNILGCRQLGSIGPLWSRVGWVLHPIDVASPMSRLGPGCVKTPMANFRVEPPSRFRRCKSRFVLATTFGGRQLRKRFCAALTRASFHTAWVKTGKAPCEHMFSALPPKADVARRHVRLVPLAEVAGLKPRLARSLSPGRLPRSISSSAYDISEPAPLRRSAPRAPLRAARRAADIGMREAFTDQDAADIATGDRQRSAQAPVIAVASAFLSWPAGACHAL